MPSSIKNILIGFFVLSAIGVIIFMLLFLHPSVGDNAKTLRVRFTDIDKVTIGTRVTYAGKPVGEVVSIQEIPDARTGRTSRKGEIYVYQLVLEVDSSVDVFNTDDILLRTSGLLGERNIDINPQPLRPGETLQNVEKQILYAEPAQSVEDTLKELAELSKKFGIVLEDVHSFFLSIEKEQCVKNIGVSINHIESITAALDQPDKLRGTIDNLYQLSENALHSWKTVDQTLDLASSFTQKANEIIDYVKQGKGTVGKLLIGDELYLRLKSIFHKGETVMNDINSYGILFHLNKRWQRLQANRVRLLDQLSHPDEFSRYFNEEMDQITDSLSRVSTALNEAENYPQSLIYEPQYTQRYSDLLKKVDNLQDCLKMYNEQVIGQEQ